MVTFSFLERAVGHVSDRRKAGLGFKLHEAMKTGDTIIVTERLR